MAEASSGPRCRVHARQPVEQRRAGERAFGRRNRTCCAHSVRGQALCTLGRLLLLRIRLLVGRTQVVKQSIKVGEQRKYATGVLG